MNAPSPGSGCLPTRRPSPSRTRIAFEDSNRLRQQLERDNAYLHEAGEGRAAFGEIVRPQRGAAGRAPAGRDVARTRHRQS